jgi:hypothetical protein
MKINQALITSAIAVAHEVFSQQTAADVQRLKDHFGQAYNETKLVAEIAVKLALRLGKIPVEGDLRAISPVIQLEQEAECLYLERFGG